MKRSTLIFLHLGLASLFLPFLLLIPLSGGLYLLGQKGEQVKTEAFTIEGAVPEQPEEFFRQAFKDKGVDFDFEYIRASGTDFVFRPSSRVHYMASKTESGTTVYRLEPDWIKRLIEIHKGHGPTLIKWLQIAFAFAILLVTFSGVYLAVIIPSYRKVMGISFGIGLLLVVLASL